MKELIECTKERKKQLSIDLWIIVIVTFVVLGIIVSLGSKMTDFAYDESVNILVRVLVIGVGGQFGVAGLGITMVCLLRKESYFKFGLNTKKLLPALGLSLLCCAPDFIYRFVIGDIHGWCPFWTVNTTSEVLASPFPYNLLAYAVTAICWGFFEGFNYVVIRDKISEMSPSKYRFWDWGAFVCAVMCILIHGAVGVTPEALMEMLVTIILIYGMLIVRKETGNAWGCILIFMVYWNAI